MFLVVRLVILDRRVCVCVCDSCWLSRLLLLFLHPNAFYLTENSVDQLATLLLTSASHSFTPCLSQTHTERPLWFQCFWWTALLPHHMTEHWSAAPAPGTPGRLRYSGSVLKPGGWRGRWNRQKAVISKVGLGDNILWTQGLSEIFQSFIQWQPSL